LENHLEPAVPLGRGRHPEGDPGRLDPLLGAGDALCHRRLGHQEGSGDLGGGEAADGT
jgi:hypothetical protein